MKGNWVYMMSNRYRGRLYVGTTGSLAHRILAHREGRGAEYVFEHRLFRLVWADQCGSMSEAITHEKRLKRWRREWKFALIETANPNCEDFFEHMNGQAAYFLPLVGSDLIQA